MEAFLLQSPFFLLHPEFTLKIQVWYLNNIGGLLWCLSFLMPTWRKCETREIKMQLSNNLYSHFGRRISPAKQMLPPEQLNKAEGTVLYIGSHFAPISPELFSYLLSSIGAEPLPTAVHSCVPLPELLGTSTSCHELWAMDTQGALTARHGR